MRSTCVRCQPRRDRPLCSGGLCVYTSVQYSHSGDQRHASDGRECQQIKLQSKHVQITNRIRLGKRPQEAAIAAGSGMVEALERARFAAAGAARGAACAGAAAPVSCSYSCGRKCWRLENSSRQCSCQMRAAFAGWWPPNTCWSRVGLGQAWGLVGLLACILVCFFYFCRIINTACSPKLARICTRHHPHYTRRTNHPVAHRKLTRFAMRLAAAATALSAAKPTYMVLVSLRPSGESVHCVEVVVVDGG